MDGPKGHPAEDLSFRLDIWQFVDDETFPGEKAMAAMATSMMRSPLRRFSLWGERCPSAWRLKRAWEVNSKGLVALLQPGRKVLHALRGDGERTDAPLPSSNVDVSRIFEYGVSPPDIAFQASAATLSYLNAFQHVVTNRLQACIAAVLLGKAVDYCSNSYYKNGVVYAFSIEDRRPTVRWCEE